MSARWTVVQGDLTRQDVDAIVNAANPQMLDGGGVDGAIHRAAGPELLAACRKVPADALGVRCPVGEARITPGFELPARWVIHTLSPVYYRQQDPAGPAFLRGPGAPCPLRYVDSELALDVPGEIDGCLEGLPR